MITVFCLGLILTRYNSDLWPYTLKIIFIASICTQYLEILEGSVCKPTNFNYSV